MIGGRGRQGIHIVRYYNKYRYEQYTIQNKNVASHNHQLDIYDWNYLLVGKEMTILINPYFIAYAISIWSLSFIVLYLITYWVRITHFLKSISITSQILLVFVFSAIIAFCCLLYNIGGELFYEVVKELNYPRAAGMDGYSFESSLIIFVMLLAASGIYLLYINKLPADEETPQHLLRPFFTVMIIFVAVYFLAVIESESLYIDDVSEYLYGAFVLFLMALAAVHILKKKRMATWVNMIVASIVAAIIYGIGVLGYLGIFGIGW